MHNDALLIHANVTHDNRGSPAQTGRPVTLSSRWVSDLIEVGADTRAFDRRVLRHPSAWELPLSRVLFHVAVHYWQQIGCYLSGVPTAPSLCRRVP